MWAWDVDRSTTSNHLAAHLAQQQQKNGSWVNPAPRWNEGDPNLATSYALLALSYCDRPLAVTPANK